jgi:dTDP-glucose pyrophosphorylase
VTRFTYISSSSVPYSVDFATYSKVCAQLYDAKVEVEQLRADGWLKPGQPAWYNAGIYLFKPSLFDFTSRLVKSPRGEYELTDAISAIIDAGHRIAGLQIEGRWVDVRDPEVLASLQS